MDDSYEDRLARALAELDASSISALNYAPPLFRIARRLGLRPRPPHYMSFRRAVLLLGPAFGVLWGAMMWLLQWQNAEVPTVVVLLASLLAGALFGLAMAGYYRWAGSQAGLSKWEDL
ncbi:hypothetical protein A8B78_03320 [Jannaschia sp. EhC01]|uniref:DUF6404 family protein n=1 Tax=Gymnodinialimonas phycosphaerae TaxID=2841589 RepID=A0A975YEJ6_9RHOB|nr:DUF6404 family protein [Gymnodinialimonas phycosphaerae]MBY4893737.1 DUF6404 family protein [Gymnodinialimonas phycosphaerae]OAN76522.1 hypothetical protein A8B78_03320 [Jannaschia sp. EhC01]